MTTISNTTPSKPVWYFAYGANMSSAIFTARRKIHPLESKPATVPSHVLCFNVMGMPYSDPGNAGLRPRIPSDDEGEAKTGTPAVMGVAYLLSAEDMARMVASEGGGVAYRVVKLDAEILGAGEGVEVWTLVARGTLIGEERRPSLRYKNVLIAGAEEQGLPLEYQETLRSIVPFDPAPTARYSYAKWTFEMVWIRISMWIQWGIHKFKDHQGNVPAWFLIAFDCLRWCMWRHHDWIHGRILARGDGF